VLLTGDHESPAKGLAGHWDSTPSGQKAFRPSTTRLVHLRDAVRILVTTSSKGTLSTSGFEFVLSVVILSVSSALASAQTPLEEEPENMWLVKFSRLSKQKLGTMERKLQQDKLIPLGRQQRAVFQSTR